MRRLSSFAVLAAVALVLAACGSSDEVAPTEPAPAPAEATDVPPATETEAPSPYVLVITIEGGEPVGGPAEIELKRGGKVVFDVQSDTPGIVHVHGYNIEKEVRPGNPASVRFEATLEGIFEIELHRDGSEAQIAELKVEP